MVSHFTYFVFYANNTAIKINLILSFFDKINFSYSQEYVFHKILIFEQFKIKTKQL